MHWISNRLTYANVMSTIAVFLVLGGVAVAATQLPKNSVGAKQLKKNAVTAAKIKKNAVTTAKVKGNAVTAAKIKAGAVTEGKLKDGAVTGAKLAGEAVTGDKINAASTPFSRIVHEANNNASLAVTGSLAAYPLNNSTYTQGAAEVNTFAAALDVTFEASCVQPRQAVAYVLIDPANPLTPTVNDIVAIGAVTDTGTGAVSKRIEPGPAGGSFRTTLFPPGSDRQHTLYLVTTATCNSGSGVTATFGGIDVIGTK